MKDRFSIFDFRFTVFAPSASLGTSVKSAVFFMILFVLTFSTDFAFAGSSTENSQALPQTVRTDPSGPRRLEMLRAETNLPKSHETEESKDKLKRLIEQVRSVRFESPGQTIEPSVVPGKSFDAAQDGAPVPEPNGTLSAAPRQRTKETEKIGSSSLNERMTEQTLKMLKDLLQNPDTLHDPLEMGEILFASGNTREAVPFYQEALKRMDPNSVSSSRDRTWILFQMGNCLRIQEPPAAAEIYRQLLVECPNSPWANVAKARKELLEWRLKEKPQDLIAEAGNDL